MRIRIFRAPTVSAAMALVRDALGPDALILATEGRDGLVEVTAALEEDPDTAVADAGTGFEPEFAPGLAHGFAPSLVPSLVPDLLDDEPAPDWLSRMPAPRSGPLDRHNLPPALRQALQEEPLDAACRRRFRFGPLPLEADTVPLMLVGPPGSGKTLTTAKLATRLVMQGHQPLVITADARRAGAVEQLAAFTRLLGLTLIAADRPETLRRALARREPATPVLVDMPALDLADPAEEALHAAFADACGGQAALVLPAGIDPAEAVEIAEAQAARGTRFLVPTRIERFARLGGVLAGCEAGGLILTEAGTSADVATGLERITPAMLSGRLCAVPPARPSRTSPSTTPHPEPPPLRPPGSFAAAATGPGGDVLSRHIAAQPGTSRSPNRKTNP